MKTLPISILLLIPMLCFLNACSNSPIPPNENAPIGINQAAIGATAKKDSPNNQKIKDAGSPYEDLVEFALNGDEIAMNKAIGLIENSWKEIRSLIPTDKQMSVDKVIADIKENRDLKDYNEVALDATVGYSYLVSSLDEKHLIVPIAVNMLDYVGFRLSVITARPAINWSDVADTVNEGVNYWKSIENDVKTNQGLYNTMVVTMEGMQEAAQSQNLGMLQFAAKVDLEVVDMLEQFYEG